MEMLQRVESLDDPFEILELSREASDEEIKKRIRELNKDFHPDHFVLGESTDAQHEEVQAAAHRVMKIVQQAYTQIKTAEARSNYAKGKGVDLDTIFEAERAITRATKHIQYGRYSEARSELRTARKADPNHEEIKAYFDYLDFLELPIDPYTKRRSNVEAKGAIKRFEEMEKAQGIAIPYALLIARIYKIQGHNSEAIQAYKRVSEYTNGKHDEAERELRLLRQRQKQASTTEKNGGDNSLLSKLKDFFSFGKWFHQQVLWTTQAPKKILTF